MQNVDQVALAVCMPQERGGLHSTMDSTAQTTWARTALSITGEGQATDTQNGTKSHTQVALAAHQLLRNLVVQQCRDIQPG
jgi:hypothetical protein